MVTFGRRLTSPDPDAPAIQQAQVKFGLTREHSPLARYPSVYGIAKYVVSTRQETAQPVRPEKADTTSTTGRGAD